MDMQEKIKKFAELLHTDTVKFYNKQYPDYPDNCLERNTAVNVKPGRKYTKVDIGGSGKYMIVNETGEIFGIKGYGVIHWGHAYGTVDTIKKWFWGGYQATRKPAPEQAPEQAPELAPAPEPAPSQDDAHRTRKGEALAKLLHLKKNAIGRYDTAWGDKTALGLYLTVCRVIEEGTTEI